MAIMYTLVLLMATSILYAAAKKESAERVFPFFMLSVMGLLYLFYCFDFLRLGAAMSYGFLILTGVFSVYRILRQKKPLLRSVFDVLTPGIFIYAAYCAFVFLYTRRNLVGLWDEMRLWGAVPKALYMTHALQLGEDALIFQSMQAYPPGMPLLVYFMELLSPSFSEGHIFVVYGIFFGAMLLPAMSGLKWKHWMYFPLLLLMLMLAPCLFTSHGGDDGWFYESLFIDPILGILAGYAFWLSTERPFGSVFSRCRFAVSLLALTIVKDSGILFAVCAAVNALVLDIAGDRKNRLISRQLSNTAVLILPILVGYGLWRCVISGYGIGSNASGFLKMELSWESMEVLWQKLLEMPMLNLQEPLTQLQVSLTYLPCLLIVLAMSLVCERVFNQKKGRDNALTWAVILLCFVVFLIGYRLSFRSSLPSFQRYVSTTLICATGYGILRNLPAVVKTPVHSWKKWVLGLLSLALVLSGCRFLDTWREKKYAMEYSIGPARTAVAKMRNTLDASPENPADIYVLIADKPRQKSLIHHRIYYELLGSNACVRNFWNDVNIVGGDDTPETWTQEDIAAAVAQWTTKLQNTGYDYVYVTTINDFASTVLEEMGIVDPAVGDLYAVVITQGKLVLEKV